MPEAHVPENQTRVRFSLRSALLTLMAVSSGIAMWIDRPAWKIEREFGGRTVQEHRFSPDSKKLFVKDYAEGQESKRWLIDLQTGERREIKAQAEPVFSPDWSKYAVLYNDESAAKEVSADGIPRYGAGVADVYRSSDGQRICRLQATERSELSTADFNGTVDYSLIEVGRGFKRDCYATFSPNGSYLLISSYVWSSVYETENGKLLQFDDGWHYGALSPDSKHVLYLGNTSTIRDIVPNHEVSLVSSFARVHHDEKTAAYSHDGSHVVTHEDGVGEIFNSSTGNSTGVFDCEVNPSWERATAEFSDDDNYVAVFGRGSLLLCTSPDGRPVFTHTAPSGINVVGFHVTRDHHWLMVRGEDSNKFSKARSDYVKVYRIGDWNDQHMLTRNASIQFAAYTPDERRMAIGYASGDFEIFDAETLKRLDVFTGTDGFAGRLRTSADGERIAAVDRSEKLITLWHRVRPEWWWGLFYLPICWMFMLCGGLLALSLMSDYRWFALFRRREPANVQLAPAGAA